MIEFVVDRVSVDISRFNSSCTLATETIFSVSDTVEDTEECELLSLFFVFEVQLKNSMYKKYFLNY